MARCLNFCTVSVVLCGRNTLNRTNFQPVENSSGTGTKPQFLLSFSGNLDYGFAVEMHSHLRETELSTLHVSVRFNLTFYVLMFVCFIRKIKKLMLT